MAEFVQQRLENFLPELEQLERVQLFTKDEIKAIVKKRKEFEYRLQRKQKSLPDYTRYINYERNLLKLIWKRRERLGYRHKKAEIDLKIVDRICQLFRIASIRFSSDPAVFLAHVDFCREMRQLAQASRVFTRLLRAHADQPQLWLSAASFELHDNNSAETCRKLMLRALRLHPSSVLLWSGYVRLELQYAAKLRERHNLLGVPVQPDAAAGGKRSRRHSTEDDEDAVEGLTESTAGDNDDDPVLSGAVAAVICREAVRKVPEASAGRVPVSTVVMELLAVCAEFNFAAGIRHQLLTLLRQEHAGEPLTYDTLARAALQHEERCEDGGATKRSKLMDRVERCCSVYEEGIAQMSAERTSPSDDLHIGSHIFRLYLTTLCEMLAQTTKHRVSVRARLMAVFQRARDADSLDVGTYLQCVRSLSSSADHYSSALHVISAGTAQYAQSAVLWIEQFDLCRRLFSNLCSAVNDGVTPGNTSEDVEEVDARVELVVGSAMVAVPDHAEQVTSLWLRFFEWSCDTSRPHLQHLSETAGSSSSDANLDLPSGKISPEDLWLAVSGRSVEIIRAVKAPYLSAIALLRGLSAARRVFDQLHSLPPLDAAFYRRMMTLETSALSHVSGDVNRLRSVYRQAVRLSGEHDVQLWLDFWRFASQYGAPVTEAAHVYNQAIKTLNPEASDEFIAAYTLLNNGVDDVGE